MGASAIPRIMGELMVNEDPILIKDLPAVKQVDTGLDHILFLTKDGAVYAMGDDTFG